METVKYFLTPPNEWFKQLDGQLNFSLEKNQLSLELPTGTGTLNYLELQEGIWINKIDIQLQEALEIETVPSIANTYFWVIFYLSNSEVKFDYNEKSYVLGLENIEVIIQSSSAQTFTVLPRHKHISIFIIVFTKQWLKQSLLKEDYPDKLGGLFLDDKPLLLFENLDFKFKFILENLDINSSGKLKIFSGVLQLLEYMVSKLNRRNDKFFDPYSFNSEDLRHLLGVKTLLDSQLNQNPPSIESLAEQTNMSLSKFKRVFFQVFGTTPYQYFLNNRMEKAMQMLLLEGLSVSEVGYGLGYSNISQFTKAFKNRHGVLPSQVRKFG